MQRTVDPKDTAILCGPGEQMFSFAAVYGCPGFVTFIANFAPDLSYSIYEAAVARDFKKLTGLVDSLAPFFSFIGKAVENHGPHTGVPGAGGISSGYMFIGVVKAAMDIVGLRGGEVRLPLVGLNKQEKAELATILKPLKIVR